MQPQCSVTEQMDNNMNGQSVNMREIFWENYTYTIKQLTKISNFQKNDQKLSCKLCLYQQLVDWHGDSGLLFSVFFFYLSSLSQPFLKESVLG